MLRDLLQAVRVPVNEHVWEASPSYKQVLILPVYTNVSRTQKPLYIVVT